MDGQLPDLFAISRVSNALSETNNSDGGNVHVVTGVCTLAFVLTTTPWAEGRSRSCSAKCCREVERWSDVEAATARCCKGPRRRHLGASIQTKGCSPRLSCDRVNRTRVKNAWYVEGMHVTNPAPACSVTNPGRFPSQTRSDKYSAVETREDSLKCAKPKSDLGLIRSARLETTHKPGRS